MSQMTAEQLDAELARRAANPPEPRPAPRLVREDEHRQFMERLQAERREDLQAVKVLMEQRIAASGLTAEDLTRMLVIVGGWNDLHDYPHRVRAMLEQEDWRETLEAKVQEIEAEHEREVLGYVQAACRAMPAAAALSHDQRLSHIRAPELRELAATHPITLGGIVLGLTEVGKTMTMVELVDRYIRTEGNAYRERVLRNRGNNPTRYPSVLLVSASAIAACVDFGQPKGELLNQAIRAAWVCIDDVGWEPPAGRCAVLELVARRYAESKPTMITSGWQLQELRAQYSDAFLRRCRETGGCKGPMLDLHPKTRGAAK